ncbi:hypothetical protein EVAR_83654_1 [Eumeta japonica]|uniref:Uncharacterized protein n=1 Tax=Eumeta variegata TaxID=151549 RepID=A0A4C1UNJ1_EUMVA|nr:hypothetical protein EVAR_83654_1 [Eumeta japonica]
MLPFLNQIIPGLPLIQANVLTLQLSLAARTGSAAVLTVLPQEVVETLNNLIMLLEALSPTMIACCEKESRSSVITSSTVAFDKDQTDSPPIQL